MEKGYEETWPDSEEPLFTKGYCVVDDRWCATVAWRDDKGEMKIALHGEVKSGTTDSPRWRSTPIIRISRIGDDGIGDKRVWAEDKEMFFSYMPVGKTSEVPIEMYRDIQAKLKELGIREVLLLLPQR